MPNVNETTFEFPSLRWPSFSTMLHREDAAESVMRGTVNAKTLSFHESAARKKELAPKIAIIELEDF